MPKDPNYIAPPRDPNRPGPLIVAEVTPVEGQLKEGHVQGFTVRCDEGVRPDGTGGTGSAPQSGTCRGDDDRQWHSSAWEIVQAALTSPMWLNACGKFPSSSPVAGSTSSDSSPTSFAYPAALSNVRRACSTSPASAWARA